MAEEKKVDTASEQSTPAKRQRTTPKQRRQQSAMRYITILFAAAFVLMLFTYLMERRQNEVLMQENQEQIEDLQQSVSAVQSLKNLYAENDALKEQLAQLEEKVNKHNNLIERTFRLEGQMSECCHDIKELKAYHKP